MNEECVWDKNPRSATDGTGRGTDLTRQRYKSNGNIQRYWGRMCWSGLVLWMIDEYFKKSVYRGERVEVVRYRNINKGKVRN